MNTVLAPSVSVGARVWERHYEKARTRPPSCLARLALNSVDFKGCALDIGAGTMNDSRLFLEEDFGQVHSMDACPEVTEFAREISASYGNRFQYVQASFEEFDFGIERHDLVHSNFGLSYQCPDGFEDVINRAISSVRDSGVFSGIFFGERDGWHATSRPVASVSEIYLRDLFYSFKRVDIKEIDLPGRFCDGRPKRWHYFRVLAKKSDASL